MNRTDRLYALVEELRAVAPRPRTARWLAGRFEVSARTIERDITALQQSGVPVWAEAARDLAARVYLVGSADPPPVPAVITDALAARRVLRIGYADRHGLVTRRDIEPLGYVGMSGRWYLLAWCRLREAVRAFRTDRIAAVTVTAQVPPPRSLRREDLDIPPDKLRRLALD